MSYLTQMAGSKKIITVSQAMKSRPSAGYYYDGNLVMCEPVEHNPSVKRIYRIGIDEFIEQLSEVTAAVEEPGTQQTVCADKVVDENDIALNVPLYENEKQVLSVKVVINAHCDEIIAVGNECVAMPYNMKNFNIVMGRMFSDTEDCCSIIL